MKTCWSRSWRRTRYRLMAGVSGAAHGRVAVAAACTWVSGGYGAPVTAAFEVSPDDPQELAEVIERAAPGNVVHLVRDGQAVADIVPAATAQTNKAERNERALAIERCQAERFGAPRLADYRKVHETSEWLWPGDAAVRRDYLVADPY